jgi:uncharacterized membrane protein
MQEIVDITTSRRPVPGQNRGELLISIAVGLLGIGYAANARFHPGAPAGARIIVGIVIVSAIAGWMALHLRLVPRPPLATLFSRSWPLWIGLLCMRDWVPNRQAANLIILAGWSCSFSLWVASKAIWWKPGVLTSGINTRFVRWALCALFVAVFTIQPWMKYHSFFSFWMDLGYCLHPLWNTVHGRILEYATIDGHFATMFDDHFSPILLLLAPFFLIAPHVLTLFFIQALGCGLAGVLLAKLLDADDQQPVNGILLQLAFYLYAPLQYGMISEFHTDPLATPFVMLMIWAFQKRSRPILAMSAVMILICKEHMGFAIAPVLLVFAFRHQPWRTGLIVAAAVACLYSILAQSVFMPFFNHGKESLALQLVYGETGLRHLATNMVAHPLNALAKMFSLHNLEQLLWLFLPLLFVPFAAIPELLSLSFMFFKELYGDFQIHSHHQAYMAPLLFWCLVAFVKNRPAGQRRTILVAVAINCLIIGLLIGESPASNRFWRTLHTRYLPDSHGRVLARALKTIPAGVSLSADSHIAIHEYNRQLLYLFPRPFPGDSTAYIAIDRKKSEWAVEIRRFTYEDRPRGAILAQFDAMRTGGAYETVFDEDSVVVLRKKN